MNHTKHRIYRSVCNYTTVQLRLNEIKQSLLIAREDRMGFPPPALFLIKIGAYSGEVNFNPIFDLHLSLYSDGSEQEQIFDGFLTDLDISN